jgi:hypothetical protein
MIISEVAQRALQVLATMNLEEARISLGSYADQLDLRCGLHRLAVGLAGNGGAGQIEPRVTELIEKTISELRRLQKEALILCILLDEEVGREAYRFVRLPLEFATVLEAKSRVTSLSQQVGTLLQEHDHREAVKNVPPNENTVAAAMRRFKESAGLGTGEQVSAVDHGLGGCPSVASLKICDDKNRQETGSQTHADNRDH